MAVLLATAGMLALSSCAIRQAGAPGMSIAISDKGGYDPPPGAQPIPLSTRPGDYDYSGIPRITFNGQPVTPIEALTITSSKQALMLGQIVPLDHPLPGRLLIVIPDHDRLRLLALQRTRGVVGGAAELQTEFQRMDLHYLADGVKQARAFAAVDIVELNDTIWPAPAGADDVLWFQVQSARPNNAGPWFGSWQMRRANGSATLAASYDPGTRPGPARIMSFVNNVRDNAGALAGGGGVVERAHQPAPGAGRLVGSGSGIAIDASGHVLTANHVIANCQDMRVTDVAGGVPVEATLVANDARLDLALLQTGQHWPAHARFRNSQTLRPGEPLVVTGFPLNGLVSPEMAVTTGSLTALSGGQGNDRLIQFSAPIQPGNSGGPVLDSYGRVVGVATSELSGVPMAGIPVLQNVNFATKADVARAYLAGIAVRLDETGGQSGLDPATIAEQARKFTIKVECWR